MSSLSPPWSGLALLAPRVDLWPILTALGGPGGAERARPADWVAAGLPFPYLAALGTGPWPGSGVRATDPGWPPVLNDVPGGPVALCARGNLDLLARPAVAVVGTRCCTAYGQEWAARIALGVTGAGGVVVSGLARGIDAAAHAASEGDTIAVLGQGLDAAMPSWQARLLGRILDRGGLVLSEFAPDTHADVHTFPIRNRIVAALARVVVVVEAGHRSGAKNTAAHALRIGRDVLAVPGPLHAEASAGCLDLLEDGAGMVRDAESVIRAAALGPPLSAVHTDDRHVLIIRALERSSRPEEISAESGLPLSAVLMLLGELELLGRVARLPGRRYLAKHS